MDRSEQPLQWDIFCKVIDNFGDIGICWRLAAYLAARGQSVRLWIDDASALAWMAPQGCAGVQVLAWTTPLSPHDLQALVVAPSEVMVEAFGCDIAADFIQACADAAARTGLKPVWINLEYLSAEAYAGRNHGLPSLVQSGPASGWTKWFFYPGFTANTGGLLREPRLAAQQSTFARSEWLTQQGIKWHEQTPKKYVSLFCYEPPALGSLLDSWAAEGLEGSPVHLLVAAGRAQQAVEAFALKKDLKKAKNHHEKGLQRPVYERDMLSISYLPLLSQPEFDKLLWACDLNFVRGEDSVIRAIWAGHPFVWQIYPQDDGAHHVKLDAFLDMLQAPPSLRSFHHQWNAGPGADAAMLPEVDLTAWQQACGDARARLAALPDLCTGLLKFVAKNR